MRRILPASCLAVLIAASSFALAAGHEPPAPPETPAPPAPLRAAAAKIIGAARSGDHAWRTLARLCDEVGPRLSGTPAYPKAAEWAAARMRELGLADVRLEPVTATQWIRGTETLSIVAPGPERRLATLWRVPDERVVEVQEVDHSATPSLLPNAVFASATSPMRLPSGYGRSNSNSSAARSRSGSARRACEQIAVTLLLNSATLTERKKGVHS